MPTGDPVVKFDVLPPLSLYVHIPWCIRKCPYCDFNSHEMRGEIPETRYVEALVADLERSVPAIWGRTVHTIFFGGGTPSLFSPEALASLLSRVRALVPVAVDAEITLEANPGTFEQSRFAEFRAAGINRLSVGIQSFSAPRLKAIGRVHDDREARKAVEIAAACFDNFNLDLMYALPGQSLDGALEDVSQAVRSGATHVSAYHLTIEPNTYFHRYPPSLPDDDESARMQEAIEAHLAQEGFENYETSAFARPGRECVHNLNYWTFGDYLGIGAGAHGKLSFRDRVVRQVRCRHPREYMARAGQDGAILSETDVPPSDLPFEFMMNALRLGGGFPLGLFEARTGLALQHVLDGLGRAEAEGFIERDHASVRPTLRGRRFLNDLLQVFLP
ncbi:MAG: oxygen-independent coproporphyrinogen III oxidase-like protein [Betaproteobacteria bacterium]|nr:oxygen-independent coproporphyrinogen III oxidase-like protein [Betaproteobacteria bacterium]